jgi:hypothetical protein
VRLAVTAALAALLAPGARAAEPRLTVRAEEPATARVLDVGLARNGRVVVLMDGALALYRLSRGGLEKLDERPLAASGVVRAPAGIVLAEPGDDTCWVATNRAPGATLYSLEGDHLWEVERAAALPWPGVRGGVGFRAGTNLIDAAVPGLGEGPFVRIGRGDPAWAITNDAALAVAGFDDAPGRVGSAGARIAPRTFVVSSALPPGADRLSVQRLDPPDVLAALDVPGTVTALGAVTRDGAAVVLAGVAREGAFRLLVVEVADAAR